MGQSVWTKYDQIRIARAATAEFGAAFAPVNRGSNAAPSVPVAGTSQFLHNVRIIKAYNNTNDDAVISFDRGATIHDVIPAMGTWVYDFTSNKSDSGGDFMFEKLAEIYIRTASGGASTGTAVYFTLIYGKGE